MFCTECINQNIRFSVNEGNPIVCPECRKPFKEEELGVVELTAQEQWDALLAIAYEWQKLPQSHGTEESEGDNEEDFLDDADTDR